MKNLDFQKIWHSVKFPLIAILMGFIFGAIFIIAAGENPLVAYGALFSGSLGGVDKLGETMYKMTPILLTGLAVGIAFRTGLFNIGGEGQYIMGTLAAVSLGWVFRTLPGFLLIPILLIGGAGAGALWASIAGILKAKRGVHEVITTIMLNYIALFLANYLVRTILNSSVLEGTEKTAYSAAVPIQGHLLKFNEW
ncbi:MAG: ABC transporter permease, partial [Eubacteriaceae bacterium]|nr:ABC transporter permease [Eubacteriaceae bacterium]